MHTHTCTHSCTHTQTCWHSVKQVKFSLLITSVYCVFVWMFHVHYIAYIGCQGNYSCWWGTWKHPHSTSICNGRQREQVSRCVWGRLPCTYLCLLHSWSVSDLCVVFFWNCEFVLLNGRNNLINVIEAHSCTNVSIQQLSNFWTTCNCEELIWSTYRFKGVCQLLQNAIVEAATYSMPSGLLWESFRSVLHAPQLCVLVLHEPQLCVPVLYVGSTHGPYLCHSFNPKCKGIYLCCDFTETYVLQYLLGLSLCSNVLFLFFSPVCMTQS